MKNWTGSPSRPPCRASCLSRRAVRSSRHRHPRRPRAPQHFHCRETNALPSRAFEVGRHVAGDPRSGRGRRSAHRSSGSWIRPSACVQQCARAEQTPPAGRMRADSSPQRYAATQQAGRRSVAIPRTEASMCLASAFVDRRGAIAAEHVWAPPAGPGLSPRRAGRRTPDRRRLR